MKSRILIVSTLIVAGSLISCSGPSSDKNAESGQAESIVNDLPNMAVTLLDGSTVDIRQLKKKAILIVFRPNCDHCQREAKEIEENLSAFGNNTLYFITSDPMQEIEKFANDYNLAERRNVFFGWTSVETVLNSYGPISVPSIYIYSSEQKLVKSFNKEVEVDLVLKYI